MKTRWWVSGLMILASQFALAEGGTVVGNGGHGVRMQDGSLALYDFVEGAVSQPDFGEEHAPLIPRDIFVGFWREKFHQEASVPYELLYRKLNQMRTIVGDGGEHVGDPFANGTLEWLFTNEAVVDPDDKDPVTDIERRLVPIAVRRGQVVTISRPAFAQLSEEHRVGLLMHESASYLLEEYFRTSFQRVSGPQRNVVVVDFMRYVFSADFRAYRSVDIMTQAYESLFRAPLTDGQRRACYALSEFRGSSLEWLVDTRTGVATPVTPERETAETVLRQIQRLVSPASVCLRFARFRNALVDSGFNSRAFEQSKIEKPIPAGVSRRERRRLEAENARLVSNEQIQRRQALWDQFSAWMTTQR